MNSKAVPLFYKNETNTYSNDGDVRSHTSETANALVSKAMLGALCAGHILVMVGVLVLALVWQSAESGSHLFAWFISLNAQLSHNPMAQTLGVTLLWGWIAAWCHTLWYYVRNTVTTHASNYFYRNIVVQGEMYEHLLMFHRQETTNARVLHLNGAKAMDDTGELQIVGHQTAPAKVWVHLCLVTVTLVRDSFHPQNTSASVEAVGVLPRRALDRFLRRVLELPVHVKPEDPTLPLHTCNAGNWTKETTPKRFLRTAFYDNNAGEELVQQLREFWADGAWFAKTGVPHRCGVLAYGPPGTGKTTLGIAIASELNRPIALLSINKTTQNWEVTSAIRKCPPGSVLIIEDIDVLIRDGSDVSLSTLLNSIDGLHAGTNITVFMTTNHPEQLPPALIRDGRFDFKVKIDLPCLDTIRRYLMHVFPTADAPVVEVMAEGLAACNPSMATIQCFAHKHRRAIKKHIAMEEAQRFVAKFVDGARQAAEEM